MHFELVSFLFLFCCYITRFKENDQKFPSFAAPKIEGRFLLRTNFYSILSIASYLSDDEQCLLRIGNFVKDISLQTNFYEIFRLTNQNAFGIVLWIRLRHEMQALLLRREKSLEDVLRGIDQVSIGLEDHEFSFEIADSDFTVPHRENLLCSKSNLLLSCIHTLLKVEERWVLDEHSL